MTTDEGWRYKIGPKFCGKAGYDLLWYYMLPDLGPFTRYIGRFGPLDKAPAAFFSNLAYMRRDYYKILEVDKEASIEVIGKAYRALSLKYHPDTSEPRMREEAAMAKMQEINEAYETLSDPDRRRAYDRTRVSFHVFMDEGLVGLARNWVLTRQRNQAKF